MDMALILRVLLLLAGGHALICTAMFLKQREMLYFPERRDEAEMAIHAHAAGLLRWNDALGIPIGWQTRDGTMDPPILIFHGNAGNILNRTFLIEKLRQSGIDARIYLLDYPGYGSRDGSPTQNSLTEAAVAALRALPSPAVVLGESLGTGVTCQAVAKCPEKVHGIILLTPFDSMTNAAAQHYPWLPIRLLLRDSYDSVKALDGFQKPVAVIVGENDEITPPQSGKKLYQSLRGPAKFWSVPQAGHDETAWKLSDTSWHDVWQFVTQGNR